MDAVIVLGAVCLGLCWWIVKLQERVRVMKIVIEGAIQMTLDIAEGRAVIEKTEEGIRVKKV